MTLEPGIKVGDYEILAQLGAGGMGRVYKVKNQLSDRIEAMKVLLPDLEAQAELANRFLREIKMQAGLDHPNIAKLYTALRIENQLLMFMEFVEGVALDARLRQGPIAMGDAIEYTVQVLSALDYAHQQGIVHRDIKPANMMLMPNGRVKLLDFGIAKAALDSRLTMTGTTLGSLYYMAPEQIQGGAVDLRSDLYSVGVSLYELVTGKKPFDGDSQFAIMSAHLARPPVPPNQVRADVPEALSEIILLALSKDPVSRFQTAGAFLNALQSVRGQTGMMPSATPASVTASTAVPRTVTGAATIPQPPALPPLPMDSLASITAHAPMQQAPPPPPPQAQPPQPEAFHLIEPTPVAGKRSGPKRIVWAAVGSLCAVGAIVAFIQFGPRGKTSAKETPVPAAPVTAAPPVTTAAQQPPVETPTPPPAIPPAATTPEAAVTPPPSVPPVQQPTKTAAKPAPSVQRAQAPVTQAPPTRKPVTQQAPPQQPPAAAPPPPQQAQAQQQAPPAPPVSLPTGETSVPAAVNRNRLDVTQLSDELDMMVVRANAIRVSLNDMRRSLSGQGLSLRGDWVEAFNAMNLYLRKANQAINDANAADAKASMAKAAVQIQLLEKALGR